MGLRMTPARNRLTSGIRATLALFALAAIGLLVWLGMFPTRLDEISESQSIRKQVAFYLIEQKYDELDRLAAEYRDSKGRTAAGRWKLSHFYSGLSDAARTVSVDREGHARFEERFLAWIAHNPKSAAAHIGYAIALIDHGGLYIRSRQPDQIDDDEWAAYYTYLGMAREHLVESAQGAGVDPHWYKVMLMIARGEGWSRERFRELLDEAVARYPYYHEIWYAAANFLMPRWYGSFREIEGLAQDAVNRTYSQDGGSLYALIYWHVSTADDGRALIAQPNPVWHGMSRGFEDMIERWPDQWLINSYARLACLARDREKAREAFALMKMPPVGKAWDGLTPTFENCVAWLEG